MQEVRPTGLVSLSTALLCFLGNGACAAWTSKLEFPSPSGDRMVRIMEPMMQPIRSFAWGLRITLSSRNSEQVLYQLRGDVFLDFAEIYWSEDSKFIGVLTCGTPTLKVAFNARDRREIPFDLIKDGMVRAIQRKYAIEQRGPAVLDWACSDEGKAAFFGKYRQIAN